MQAITTKYLPATNFKGSRIKASCEAGSVTISYPHEAQRGHEAHVKACRALAEKLRWTAYLHTANAPVAGIEFAPGRWVFLPEAVLEWY